jgi:hypothetical protein
MNKEQFAKMLDGREYGNEITKDEEKIAKDNDLVVVFGYSDDNVEFCGAIHDEVGAYEGAELFVTTRGVLEDHDDCECPYCAFEELKKGARKIEALWNSDDKHSWIFKTEIPHATFEIVEDGEPFCRGIVFNFSDLKKE